MLETVAAALLPAIVTVALGYLAARHHDFQAKDAQTLNRMVMTYALPIALFLGTVSATRAALFKDAVLLITFFSAIVGLYGVVFLICRFAFRFSLGMSALGALGASVPNSAFIGLVVLGSLYGTSSGVVVAISAVIQQVTVVPLTIVLLSLDASGAASRSDMWNKVLDAFKQPVVWVPLLGFVSVLLDIPVPKLVADSFVLLGNAASGVALFSAGIILAGYTVVVSGPILFLVFVKNIAQPALVWGSLSLLGYTNPLLGEGVVTTALPMIVLTVMLSVQYQVGERQFASALFISLLASFVTTSAFIFLVAR